MILGTPDGGFIFVDDTWKHLHDLVSMQPLSDEAVIVFIIGECG